MDNQIPMRFNSMNLSALSRLSLSVFEQSDADLNALGGRQNATVGYAVGEERVTAKTEDGGDTCSGGTGGAE